MLGSMYVVTSGLEGENGFLEERITTTFRLHTHINNNLQASKLGLIQRTVQSLI